MTARRRGALYVMVLFAALITSTLGLAAVRVVGVEAATPTMTAEEGPAARLAARAGLEIAQFRLKQGGYDYAAVATAYGGVTTQLPGAGSYTFTLTDTDDDDLSDGLQGLLRVTSTGTSGRASRTITAEFTPDAGRWPNLLTNPGAETAAVSPWAFTDPANGTIATTTDAYSGAYAFAVDTYGIDTEIAHPLANAEEIIDGERYVVTARVKHAAATPVGVRIRLVIQYTNLFFFTSTTTVDLAASADNPVPGGVWTEVGGSAEVSWVGYGIKDASLEIEPEDDTVDIVFDDVDLRLDGDGPGLILQ
ncbi:MAG: hypothetical protein AAF532_08020 [Planctomycetota bacterium]